MRTLVLNKNESLQLLRYGVIEITRNGFDILVYDDGRIFVVNPYDKVLLHKELRK